MDQNYTNNTQYMYNIRGRNVVSNMIFYYTYGFKAVISPQAM